MNKILLLLLFIIPLSLFGQVESQFNGTLNVFSASRIGFTNTFTISGIFTSTTTSYTSANSAVGDIVQVQSGSRFYWMHIYSIASNSGGVITCNVRDSSSTLTTFPSGKWSIFRPTTNLRLPLSPDGETNASRSATFNTLALRVDEIQASVASSTNCELTITKTAHGFRKWTPVFYNGSTYVRPTNDTIVPDYIVVDSLTANTFKVATCGTYATVLPNGLYWYTNESPGYSLTPDTTKAPLFQVIDSTLILDPIVGFNLMSGSGGTADGNGIYSGSDSLSQENTYAAMAADGSQTFALGHFSDPLDPIAINDYGLLIDFENYGQAGFYRNRNGTKGFSGVGYNGSLFNYSSKSNSIGSLSLSPGFVAIQVDGVSSTNKYWKLQIDSVKFEITRNISGTNRTYNLLPASQYPSTTSGVTNILKWTGDGSNAVPSFGLVPNIYNEDGNLGNNVTRTFGQGSNGDFIEYRTDVADKRHKTYLSVPNGNADYDDEARVLYQSGGTKYRRITHYKATGIYEGTGSYVATYLSSERNGADHLGLIEHYVSIGSGSTGNQAGLIVAADSTNLNTISALKMITENAGSQRTHWAGLVDGSFGNGGWGGSASRFIATSPSYKIRTNFFNSNTGFDWFGVDMMDTDTTSNSFFAYNRKYRFVNTRPSSTTGAISVHVHTGTSTDNTPSFLRMQYGAVTASTTDASGDITVTIPAMPDATYLAATQVTGTTLYRTTVHTLTTTTFKVRCFDAAGVVLGAGITVPFTYDVKDL